MSAAHRHFNRPSAAICHTYICQWLELAPLAGQSQPQPAAARPSKTPAGCRQSPGSTRPDGAQELRAQSTLSTPLAPSSRCTAYRASAQCCSACASASRRSPRLWASSTSRRVQALYQSRDGGLSTTGSAHATWQPRRQAGSGGREQLRTLESLVELTVMADASAGRRWREEAIEYVCIVSRALP